MDSFLLMRHANRFDLPKGHVEPGETETECALREMEEETGLDRGQVDLDPDFRFATTYPVRPARFGGEACQKTTVIFLGRVPADVAINPTEHLGFIWYRWSPPHRIQPETIDPLLQAVQEFLEDRKQIS